jgi:hypothetical protein
MAMAQFGTLTSYIRIASSSCVACFVMESRDGMKVVSMGSGTGYYTNEFAPEDPRAEMVMDGHAEVSWGSGAMLRRASNERPPSAPCPCSSSLLRPLSLSLIYFFRLNIF